MKKNSFLKMCFSLAILLVVPFTLRAQSVGVVLSGGGAKGLYHIGILKALEENNIPVDYIAGTSMGAIVAGLYAAGYTPREMEVIFTSEEIRYWLTGRIEDKYFYFFKKLPPNASMITVDINRLMLTTRKNDENEQQNSGDRHVTVSPSSLIPSSQLDLGFMEYFAAVTAKAHNNFDSLFIPFRCVSVDAASKREFVWKEGDLGMAIRSSMAIPVVFSPVIIDSMVMFDGGIMNNFPWQEMEDDFGPDVIIGGKCVSGKAADLMTLPGQIEALLMSNTDYELPPEMGLMISRSMDDVGMLDFRKAASTIQQGYVDAMEKMPEIKNRISRRVGSDELYLKRLRFRSDLPDLVFEGYDITGISNRQKKYVTRQLRKEVDRDDPDGFLNFEEFKMEYNKLLSESTISTGFPLAIYNDTTGYFRVQMAMHTKPGLKVMAGGNISSSSLNQGFVGLQYDRIDVNRSTYMLDAYLGAYYSSVNLGVRYTFNRYRPFALDVNLTYNFYDYVRGNGQQILFKNENEGYSRLNEYFLSAAFSTPVKRSSVFRAGATYGVDVYKYFLDTDFSKKDKPDRTTFPFLAVNAQYERNTLNYIMYPTAGMQQTISGLFVTGTEKTKAGTLSSRQIDGRSNRTWGGGKFLRQDYGKWTDWLTHGYHLEALYSIMPDMHNAYADKVLAPAFQPVPLSKILYMPEFRNPSYLAVGIMPTVVFGERFYLRNEAYAYLPELDHLKRAGDHIRFMYTSTLVYQTPIGPISLGVSYFDVNNIRRWYGVFNIGFVLFNRRGIDY